MTPDPHRRSIRLALAVMMAGLMLALAQPARADSGYAALLVLFGPDDYHTECIPMPGNMTAFDLVRASALNFTIESPGNGPEALCSIDGVGCEYPGESCFCQCSAAACALWTEWYWDVNRWEVAFDADERIIPDGAVEAWVWGDGMTEPPIVSFGDICTGVMPGDTPALPTVTPATDPSYPGPTNATPTFWIMPTRPPVATAAPTATRTATLSILPPGSQFTPGASTPAPSATRFATPTWMATRPADVSAGAPSPTPTEEPSDPTATPEPALGSPTPDQVALLIDASAARVRGTALAAAQPATQTRPGSAGTWALGIVAAVMVSYALLLQRQRRLDALQTPTPGATGSENGAATSADKAPPADAAPSNNAPDEPADAGAQGAPAPEDAGDGPEEL